VTFKIPNNLIWPLVVLIIVFGAFYTKPWQTKPVQTVSVTAQGKAQAIPTIAKITASIESNNPNLDQARAENQNRVDAIITKLKAVGIDQKDIKTQYLSAGGSYPVPMMYPQRQTNAFTTSLEITIRKLTNADTVLAALTSNGATNIYGPQLTVDDTKLETAKSQARQNAVDNAAKKAQELAKASGRKVGKVVSIKEQGDYAYPIPLMAVGGADLQEKASQIQPGQNDVTINLLVDFELR
jgi:hypothetical protein